ncbi:MAG: CPBP family intramembrane metalloprotease [Anaerolineae bacterium]|nr:MAG: CPBP family intramembrane metalloprotease [Anaerolineae bacterium]
MQDRENDPNARLDARRIYIYLAWAFGLAWIASLVIYLTGGLRDSPELLPGTGITLALALLAGPVMWSPALAHILTRLLTGEGWQEVGLRPRLKRGWPYWLAAWFLPGLLSILGAALFFLLYPRHYDPSLSTLHQMIESRAPAGVDVGGIDLWTIVAMQVAQAMLISPLINGLSAFGEEYGWRAYLQPKLVPVGGRKAMLWMGLIWGVWHWPAVLMGHNYGLDYPGAPYLGPLVTVWFTLILGVFLGWLTLKAGSVWPATIGHAAINGMANLGTILSQGRPNPLLGPAPVGLIGGAGFTLLALLIWFSPWGLRTTKAVTTNKE